MSIAASVLVFMRRQSWSLLAASSAGWLILLLIPADMLASALCGGTGFGEAGWDSMAARFALQSPSTQLLIWSAMIIAMMLPLLKIPLAYVRLRSLDRRRWRATGLFLSGYLAIWLVAGSILTIFAIALGIIAGAQMPAIALTMALALIWQLTPAKQSFLNRCHQQPRLAALGLDADADVLGYGVVHGLWCIGACWALMLLPLMAGSWHLLAMALVTLIILYERGRRPRRPCWRWPLAAAFPINRGLNHDHRHSRL